MRSKFLILLATLLLLTACEPYHCDLIMQTNGGGLIRFKRE